MNRTTLKRVRSGIVALAMAAAIVPFLPASVANAAGVLQGRAEVRNAGGASQLFAGTSSTTFTLRLPAAAACGGDSANGGYRVQSYIVPATVDPRGLTFNASGPVPAGVGGALRQPLFDTSGTPYVNAQTADATSPGGPGPIVNIPDFNYAVFSPGNIPAGKYNVGIACTLGPAGPTQMKEYWNTTKNFAPDAGGGPAQVKWSVGLPVGRGPGCRAVLTPPGTGNPGAGIDMFPAAPASQSNLVASCLFQSAVGHPDYAVSSAFTLHDFENSLFHNGAARTVTAAAGAAAGATTFTITDATGTAAFVNRSIAMNGSVAGTVLPTRAFVKSIVGTTVTLNQATNAAIPAGATFKIDNSSARSTNDIVQTNGSTTLTSVKANFTAADVGCSVSGQFIPEGSTITAVTNATTATMSNAATGTAVTNAERTVTLCGSVISTSHRTVDDAIRSTTTHVETVAGRNAASDVGLLVTGTGIAANTIVTSISGAGNKNLNVSCPTAPNCVTVSATPSTIVIGEATPTAPAATDTASNLAIMLDLNPALVAGSGECAADVPEGFITVASIRNPGNFASVPFGGTIPSGVRVQHQLVFDTSASDFAGYIVNRPAITGGDPIAGDHYDIVFPNLPTTLALCPSASSPGLGIALRIFGQTISQSALTTGTGRPGTTQLRALKPSTSGYATSATLTSEDLANPFSPTADFQRLCLYPATPVVEFTCGNG